MQGFKFTSQSYLMMTTKTLQGECSIKAFGVLIARNAKFNLEINRCLYQLVMEPCRHLRIEVLRRYCSL